MQNKKKKKEWTFKLNPNSGIKIVRVQHLNFFILVHFFLISSDPVENTVCVPQERCELFLSSYSSVCVTPTLHTHTLNLINKITLYTLWNIMSDTVSFNASEYISKWK